MPRRRLHPSEGATPPRTPKTTYIIPQAAELRDRKKRMWTLVLSRATPEEILEDMQQRWPTMSDQVVRKLHKDVRDALEANSRESILMEKETQKKRIIGHIGHAMKSGNWNAVASLENTYSRVAGTASEITINHNHNADPRFSSAFQRVLMALTGEQAKLLLEGHDVPLGGLVEAEPEPAPVELGEPSEE